MATAEQVPATAKPKENLPAISAPRLPYHPAIEERFGIDKASWKALVEAIFPNAVSTDSVILALSYCRARKLDPFKRNVHIVPIYNKDLRCMVDSVWPGIGELRTTAFRTGLYAGRSDTKFGADITQKVGQVEVTFPEWAQVTVFRMVGDQRVEFCGPRVYWLETYAVKGRNDDSPNQMWADRPRGQIDKCFDSETEVLTEAGFQPFGFVTARIMQVTDRGLEPTEVAPFSQPYDGRMIACDGDSMNFCVTPNHDMITTVGKVEAGAMFAAATSSAGHGIPLTLGSTQGRSDAAYADNQLLLAAAIVCDGYKHGNGYAIAVSRKEKVAELERIGLYGGRHVRHCAGDKSYTSSRTITTKSDKTVFQYRREMIGDLLNEAGEFELPEIQLLSRRQARLVVDALVRFDGSTSRTARRFYSSNQSILGAFELLACIAGYCVSRRRERRSDIGGSNWYITLSTKEQGRVFRASGSQARLKGGMSERPNADGYVWCCRVPSGAIIVRRKGLSMLCGNCAEAAALRSAFPEEIADYIPEEVQHDRVIDAPSKPSPDKPSLNSLADKFADSPYVPPTSEATDEAAADEANQGEAPDDVDQRTEEEKADESLRLPPEHPLYELQAMLDVADTLGAVNKAQASYKGPDSDQLLWSMVDNLAEARREKIRAGRGK